MDIFKHLSPEAIAVVGALWILREVLGFVTKFIRSQREDECTDSRLLLDLIKKISDHLDVQTDLVKQLVFEMKSMQKDLVRISSDVDRLRRPALRD